MGPTLNNGGSMLRKRQSNKRKGSSNLQLRMPIAVHSANYPLCPRGCPRKSNRIFGTLNCHAIG